APDASWHRDHADSAYVYIGGLPFDLSEGDIITIFSQYGEPTFVKLVRDKETGKSKGFAFLKYEDQRSTDLAVDNLGGAAVMGRVLKVDHTRYKKGDDDEEEIAMQAAVANGNHADDTEKDEDEDDRPMLKEEKELAALLREHDEEDPMKEYLVQQKKEEMGRRGNIVIIISIVLRDKAQVIDPREINGDTSAGQYHPVTFRKKNRGGEDTGQVREGQGVRN
ncbi:MAG: hypothetical protein Q9219_007689, partial [cf. Caloplaca sp. 3 TL-2023]